MGFFSHLKRTFYGFYYMNIYIYVKIFIYIQTSYAYSHTHIYHIHQLTPIFFLIFLYSFYIPLSLEWNKPSTHTALYQLLRPRMICKRRICSCAGCGGPSGVEENWQTNVEVGGNPWWDFYFLFDSQMFEIFLFGVFGGWFSVNLFGSWNLSWSMEIVLIFVFGKVI